MATAHEDDQQASSARERVAKMLDSVDPYDYSAHELRPLQMAAAQEMFVEMRGRISVLDRRAKDGGIDRIEKPADIVPLLLSHTTYKTYPQSFVQKRQWDQLARWLALVSTESFDHVDVKDAVDIDDFLNRMWAAGYKIVTSSGTSGKVSLLPKNDVDIEYFREFTRRSRGIWPNYVKADQSRHFFQFGPIKGPTTAAFMCGYMMEDFGRPDSRYALIEEPLLISTVTGMAEIREKMKAGTATPEEIREMEAQASEQAARSAARFDEMIDRIFAHRNEPMFVRGGAAQMFEVVERARSKGITGGDFHPDTFIGFGGGVKHFKLPPDWKEQIKAFFGDVHYSASYAMSEMNWGCVACANGRYHIPPSMIPLILEEGGEKLVEPQSGTVVGRMALLDLTTQIRWGGVISGDKVTVDLEGECPCGIGGPNILGIDRYLDIVGDDKIQCSGTIDAYIRGSFSS